MLEYLNIDHNRQSFALSSILSAGDEFCCLGANDGDPGFSRFRETQRAPIQAISWKFPPPSQHRFSHQITKEYRLPSASLISMIIVCSSLYSFLYSETRQNPAVSSIVQAFPVNLWHLWLLAERADVLEGKLDCNNAGRLSMHSHSSPPAVI